MNLILLMKIGQENHLMTVVPFKTHPEEVQGSKLRVQPESFADHFSQATMHYHSLEKHEQQHTKDAYSFELY